LQTQANAAHAQKRVFLGRHRPVRQRLVTTDIQRAHHQRTPLEGFQHAAVLGFLSRLIRRLGMVHEHQFGTQQANAFGAHRHGLRGFAGSADVGSDLDMMTVTGDSRLQATLICQALALLAGGALVAGLLQLRIGWGDQQFTALAVKQQQGVWR